MSSKRISLAQQLAHLDQPAPLDFDPEDATAEGADQEDPVEKSGSAGREHYVDVGTSALRKLHDNVSDSKYSGVRVSRKQLGDSDAEMSDDGPDAKDRPVTSEEDGVDGESAKDSEEDDEEGSGEITRLDHVPEAAPMAPSVPLPGNDLSSTLKRTRDEERKKGKSVSRQLAMYDSLLDARIRLQKCVTSMNRLPDASGIPNYLLEPESRDAANAMLAEAISLADDLFELQEKLIASRDSIKPPSRKRRKLDVQSGVDHDWEEELSESASQFEKLESALHPYVLTTLQKWSNKVLAISPSALLPSNRTKFSGNKANHVKSAVQLVDEALLDHRALVSRTRIWRGKGSRIGSKGGNDSENQNLAGTVSVDTNASDIFDDTDFYQSLLREVIDMRAGAGGARPDGLDDVAANWRAAQKQQKARRASTVDTRASKGRKLRFEVHEKLQNFMAPAPPPSVHGGSLWHEAQIDELFAGLLGKGFAAGAGEDVPQRDGPPSMDVDVGQALKGGFRVFG
ncbi:hypothetical protein M0805_006544 [Coniferiporia weirii]|nr:hypothetical protein M0805_006544 [Coniferiporia weirii]